jgi:hypothetical protein
VLHIMPTVTIDAQRGVGTQPSRRGVHAFGRKQTCMASAAGFIHFNLHRAWAFERNLSHDHIPLTMTVIAAHLLVLGMWVSGDLSMAGSAF